MHAQREVGHSFLARLGKKRLRPGGLLATNWLLAQAAITAETAVLEVACNRCVTSVELAQRYGCRITAVDVDAEVLEQGRAYVHKQGMTDLIQIQQANAMNLPFGDDTFDLVINEAMLTMLTPAAKAKAVAEYYRVLRPGGVLLTHDVVVRKEDAQVRDRLRQTINIPVTPLSVEGWHQLFAGAGFSGIAHTDGKMTLMNPIGMVRDEGLFGTLKIIRNGLRAENRPMFRRMFAFFNHPDISLGYIAVCSRKDTSLSLPSDTVRQ